jgi:hypothetical protein
MDGSEKNSKCRELGEEYDIACFLFIAGRKWLMVMVMVMHHKERRAVHKLFVFQR